MLCGRVLKRGHAKDWRGKSDASSMEHGLVGVLFSSLLTLSLVLDGFVMRAVEDERALMCPLLDKAARLRTFVFIYFTFTLCGYQ